MIASVRGRVAVVGVDAAVVEVGGVGLAVRATPATLAGLRRGAEVCLPTALVVREDSLTLYAFSTEDERTMFELLQSVSGVGPRLAIAVLAVLDPAAVRRAVATEDLAALTRVPGIGRKGAQRMVLELRDRLPAPHPGAAAVEGPAAAVAEARAALVELGYTPREADDALAAVGPAAVSPAAVGSPGAGPAAAPQADAAVAPQADAATVLRAALAVLRRG